MRSIRQFLQAPTISHYQGVKRILRYIKGTLSFGLMFSRPSSTTILGYSDADWARYLETRRSTYGFSIFLGATLFLGAPRNSLMCHVQAVSLNIGPWQMPWHKLFGSLTY